MQREHHVATAKVAPEPPPLTEEWAVVVSSVPPDHPVTQSGPPTNKNPRRPCRQSLDKDACRRELSRVARSALIRESGPRRMGMPSSASSLAGAGRSAVRAWSPTASSGPPLTRDSGRAGGGSPGARARLRVGFPIRLPLDGRCRGSRLGSPGSACADALLSAGGIGPGWRVLSLHTAKGANGAMAESILTSISQLPKKLVDLA